MFLRQKGLTGKFVNPFYVKTPNDKFYNPFQKNILVTDFVTPFLKKTKNTATNTATDTATNHVMMMVVVYCYARTRKISQRPEVFAKITELTLDRLLLSL